MSKKSKHTISNETLRYFEQKMREMQIEDLCGEILEQIAEFAPKKSIQSFKYTCKRIKELPPTKKEKEILQFARKNNNPINVIKELESKASNEKEVHHFLLLLKNVDPRLRKNEKINKYGLEVTFLLYLELWQYDVSNYLDQFYVDLPKEYKLRLLDDILSDTNQNHKINTYLYAKLIKKWNLEKDFTGKILPKYNISGLSGDLYDCGSLYFGHNIYHIMEVSYNYEGYDLLFLISYIYPHDFVKFMKDHGRIDQMYLEVTRNISYDEENNLTYWVENLFGYVPESY